MKLNIKIFSTNELKVTPDLELHDLKNLFSMLINKGELNVNNSAMNGEASNQNWKDLLAISWLPKGFLFQKPDFIV